MEAAQPIAELLHEWREFFVTIATACATLIGSMFVVVSIGSGFLTEERSAGTQGFFTPTVFHLTASLLGCALTMVPGLDRAPLSICLAMAALAGLAYCAMTATRVWRFAVDITDHVWYTALPVCGYLVIGAAAYLILRGAAHAIELLAAGLVLLLVCGIRNAWDLIIFLLAKQAKKD